MPTPSSSGESSKRLSASPPRISVLVVDDHHVVRIGLCAVLRDNPRLNVVGEAGTAAEAEAMCDSLNPDVVLMDIRMPGGSGIDACRQIRQRHPKTRVLFLTSYSDTETLAEALKAGADGYVLKSITGENISESVEKIARGDKIVDPVMTLQLIDLATAQTQRTSAAATDLTQREDRILALIHAGQTNKEIGLALGVSEKTIRNALSSVFARLGAATRREAAERWAARRNPMAGK